MLSYRAASAGPEREGAGVRARRAPHRTAHRDRPSSLAGAAGRASVPGRDSYASGVSRVAARRAWAPRRAARARAGRRGTAPRTEFRASQAYAVGIFSVYYAIDKFALKKDSHDSHHH